MGFPLLSNYEKYWLYKEFPEEYLSIDTINKRRNNLIARNLIPDVSITTNNRMILVVAIDTHVDDWELRMLTSVETSLVINTLHEKGLRPEYKDDPIILTSDLSRISNAMLDSVSDVVIVYPINDNDDKHYEYISLLKELNNEPDAFFKREIRYGHNMQRLIQGYLADLWPELTKYKKA